MGGTSTAPVVSVIVPSRDAAAFIGDALFSLARQFDDQGKVEIVVVDDGSTDDTASIAQEAGSSLERLTIIRNASSRGVSAARNQGLDVARGRFIAFLDADDWFGRGHLGTLARAMDALGCDFVRTDTVVVTRVDREFRRAPQGRRGVVLDPRDGIVPVQARTMVDHPWVQAGLFSRTLADRGLLRFREDLRTTEDRVLMWELHLNAHSYAVVDAPGFFYRREVAGSLTRIVDERRLDYLAGIDAIRLLAAEDRQSERFLPKAAQTALALTAFHLESFDLMASSVQEGLVEGARRILEAYPAEVMSERVAALDAERAAILQPVLQGSAPGSVR